MPYGALPYGANPTSGRGHLRGFDFISKAMDNQTCEFSTNQGLNKMNIVVTLKSNVSVSEIDGNFELDEDGDLVLLNDEDVGILTKTHLIQVSQIDQVTNTLQTGVVPQSEVYWNMRRSPAPALHAPTDLVWLSIPGDDEPDDEYQEQEADDNFSESEVG